MRMSKINNHESLNPKQVHFLLERQGMDPKKLCPLFKRIFGVVITFKAVIDLFDSKKKVISNEANTVVVEVGKLRQKDRFVRPCIARCAY
jgi:hypothetical protein